MSVHVSIILPQKLDGLGQLLFEMLKGVQGQFHSCTEKVYLIFVLLNLLTLPQKSLKLAKIPWNEMYSTYIFAQICFINWGWHLEKVTTVTNLIGSKHKVRPCQKYTMVLRYRRPLQISAIRSFLLPTNKKIAAAQNKI